MPPTSRSQKARGGLTVTVRREKARIGDVRQSVPRVGWAYRQGVYGLWAVGVSKDIVARVVESRALFQVVCPVGDCDG